MFSKYKKKILLSAAIGALIFLGFSIYADFDNLVSALVRFNWYYFPIILTLSFGNYIFRFFKWEYYRKLIGIDVSPKLSFLIFLSSFVMSVTPGKLGEILKSYLIKEETGTPVSKSAPIILAERLTDFISMTLLCLVGAFVFDYGKEIIILIGICFLGFTIMLSSRKASFFIISLFEKISFLKKRIHHFHNAYESVYQMIRLKPLLSALTLSIIGWFMECFGFYIVLNEFSVDVEHSVTVLTATFIYGFATLVGAIAMLPGGLGLTEASLTGLLQLLKIPKNISVASTIIIRLATLWFGVFIGIVSVYFYQRYSNKNISELNVNKV